MRRLVLLAAALLIGGTFLSAKPVNDDDALLSGIYVLMEPETRTVLEEKDCHKRCNAGYLSKLMALLLIAEDIDSGRLSLTEELTASETVYGTKGAVVWLSPGDNMTVDELIKSAAVGNANDAITVLAEHSAGSIEEFTARMNAAAFDLGLRDTAFFSPYGYYDEREHTTAYDMAVICSELLEHETVMPYFSIWRDHVKSGQTELVNENTLSRTYDLHCGFKACHSDEAGYCIAECGKNDKGEKYIAVVLGSPDQDTSFHTAKTLIRSGFSGYRMTASAFPEDALRPVSVRNGEAAAVELGLAENSDLVVPKGESRLRIVTVLPEYLEAPLSAGQLVGKAAFFNGKELVFETDVIVKNDVNKLTFRFILEKIMYKTIN
ncbi:MAG: D-alanyl-D-alanine carboxypeptidase [Ruminococcus sp.]|nr:D-alanyl-D-alanine carboxypeptidase [Ruminococcus sp.]